ncbi:MAG TPA: sulfite exporter TauE/SafE family protein [Selenomonadales bacterium]|nr:sulfite exporter TauE/SafE family protein [Selenomonadales bacterium]
MNQSVKLIAAGLGVGILSGFLGVGGGIFIIPLLVTYFAVAHHEAVGISLAVVIPTALVSGVVYGLHGNIELGVSLNLVVASMIGSWYGARLARKIPEDRLEILFGGMLVVVGLRMVIA